MEELVINSFCKPRQAIYAYFTPGWAGKYRNSNTNRTAQPGRVHLKKVHFHQTQYNTPLSEVICQFELDLG